MAPLADTHNKKTAVASAKLKQLLLVSKSGMLGSTFLAFTLVYIARDIVAFPILVSWLAIIILVALIRAGITNHYLRAPTEDYRTISSRLNIYRVATFIAGLSWGAISFFIFPNADQQQQILLIFILATLTAGATISFSADFISTFVYSALIFTPLLISLYIESDGYHLPLTVAGLVYLTYVLVASRKINANLHENIVLNLDALEKERQAKNHTENLRLNNEILSHINKQTPLPIMFKELALHVEALHPGMICAIMLLSHDGKTIHTAAAPNLPDFYTDAIEGATIGDNTGSCGTATFRGERVVVEDIQTHPFWANYKGLAGKAGLQSCWSQPFKNENGQVLGTFAIYHKEIKHPSDNELKLILNYAHLVLLAIENSRAQNNLSISAIAFEAQGGMLVTDANRVILRANRDFTKITGYFEQEVVGKVLGMHDHLQHEENQYASLWESLEGKDVSEGVFNSSRKNGEAYPEQLSITRVKSSSGTTTNYVASLLDITVSKAAAEEIQSLAFYDPLTKLPNRRLFIDRLQLALEASAISAKHGALIFLDLDQFKTLNDSLGHHVGDLLLQEVAKRLTTCVREGDVIARLGGDEYLILLENLSDNIVDAADQAKLIGDKVLTALSQPYQLGNNTYQSTTSLGVALFKANEKSIEDLLKHADIAMYQAKKSGRNAMQFFDPQMQKVIHARVELESELREALYLKQFQLHYQVQVDQHGAPIGAEALIRWNHPKRGLIYPLDFILLAEETGLILPIGQWVLNAACVQLKAWQLNTFTSDFTLSINVSAKQFRQDDFVEQVQTAVDSYGIDPTLLKLELTESILLESIENTITTMNALREAGIKFSLDDFGTGYSSLQYLKRLPLDQLKIDQPFVRDIIVDSSDKAIVQTIIVMAQSMELEVIAEGVESEEQLQALKSKGCLNFQGYLFSKPMPVEAFNILLEGMQPETYKTHSG